MGLRSAGGEKNGFLVLLLPSSINTATAFYFALKKRKLHYGGSNVGILLNSGEGAQPGDGAEQQPGGAAAAGHQAIRRLPEEDGGARHPLPPPLLPGGLQEGHRQQKAQAQGRSGQLKM